jgi:adenosylcobinamide-GDP ribazoletransferase
MRRHKREGPILDADAASPAPAAPAPLAGWRALARDVLQMIRFYSRLPTPKLAFEADKHAMPDFRTAPRMLPLAAIMIAMPAALLLLAGGATALPPLAIAAVCVAVAALSTGAFHEDGLADTFDGLGGGMTPERRLEIMRDSRIGAFGGAALMLALILRVALLAALIERIGAERAAALYLAAAALSRSVALLPLAMLPPARPDGFSTAVGRPTMETFVVSAALSLLMAGAAAGLAETPIWPVALGVAIAVLLVLTVTWWAFRTIRGQTGDIAGACQQLAEIGFYLGVVAVLNGAGGR